MSYGIKGRRSKRGKIEDLTGRYPYKTRTQARKAIRNEISRPDDERMIFNPRIYKKK